LPVLAAIEGDFAEDGLIVVTICIAASAEKARETANEVNAKLMIALDPGGEVASAYRVRGTPTTYLVDEEGVVQFVQIGYGVGSEKELRKAIVRLLAEAK
jgi:hypothetical protein